MLAESQANSVPAASENGDAAASDAATAIDYTAYPPPLRSTEKPVTASAAVKLLSPEHVEMYKEVLGYFRNDAYRIAGVRSGKLTDEERFWLSKDCVLRYLRATRWSSGQAAIERLEATLRWRRNFGVYDLTAEQVEPEAVTGKEFIFGYDVHGRPALYMVPSRQNTKESPRQIQYVVWMMERALDLTGPGIESIVLMINFADRGKNPSISTSKLVLNILQTHYPERLANSLVLNVPFLIHTFLKMISPLIDPVTRNKIKYNPKPVEDGLFAADELIKEGGWGGTRNFVWDHKKYWPQLVQMCAETRAKQMARWRKLGARVGCDEWDYKSEDFDDTSSSVAPSAALEAKADTTETTPDSVPASPKTDDLQAQPPAEEAEVIAPATGTAI